MGTYQTLLFFQRVFQIVSNVKQQTVVRQTDVILGFFIIELIVFAKVIGMLIVLSINIKKIK